MAKWRISAILLDMRSSLFDETEWMGNNQNVSQRVAQSARPRFWYRLVRSPHVPLLSIAAVFAIGPLRVAKAGDSGTVLTRLLRDIVSDVRKKPLLGPELSRIGCYTSDEVLAEVGLAQLSLTDLTGAQSTSLFVIKPEANRRAWDFANELAFALTKASHSKVSSEIIRRTHDVFHPSTRQMCIAARMQAEAGDIAAARQLCYAAIHDLNLTASARPHDVRPTNQMAESQLQNASETAFKLLCVALTQSAIGDSSGAYATRALLPPLINQLPPSGGNGRAWLLPVLAILDARLGDTVHSETLLMGAARKPLDATCNWRAVAIAEMENGHLERALQVSKMLEWSFADLVRTDLAINRASHGDIRSADRIVSEMDPSLAVTEILRLELSRSKVRSNDTRGALVSVNKIKNDSRRAEGMLQIATVIAKQGKAVEARKLIRGLDYPKMPVLGLTGAYTFSMDDQTSWVEPYETSQLLSPTDAAFAQATQGNLLSAAVRCKTVMYGGGSVRLTPRMCKYCDIRKAAEAQGFEGDVAGVLRWADALDRPLRVIALVGCAQGYGMRSQGKEDRGEEIRFNRRHELFQLYGIDPDDLCQLKYVPRYTK